MIIQVKVQPSASRTVLKFDEAQQLKLFLTAPAVDGKANKACIEFFAKQLRIPRSKVQILSGLHTRQKRIALLDVGEDEFWEIFHRRWTD